MAWRKQKQFPCSICGKDFSKESPLKKHVKDAHNVEYKEYLQRMEESNANSRKN